jgi:hypothetical protein
MVLHNQLLQALSVQDFSILQPQLEPVSLPAAAIDGEAPHYLVPIAC